MNIISNRSVNLPSSVSAIHVRQAQSEDLPGIASIEQLSFSDPWSEHELSAILSLPHTIFLVSADHEGSVSGYAVVRSVSDEAEILNLAVSQSWRRAGLGGMLLDAAIGQAQSRGARAFFLEVRKSNTAARSLYESRGFRQLSIRKRYYRNPVEDALVLYRETQ
ncbi:MAG TPA: ribosomal protein S18-alanine N-acetyltransferase [Gemmatimonadaceae bacterium]|nr:ribosomal protein S18-alanine N-acetyltransferase [Gemmatimonadaceae bacterium]